MIIQRFAMGLWPQMRGEIPFIALGPNFKKRAAKREPAPPGRPSMEQISFGFMAEVTKACASILSDVPACEAKRLLSQALLEEEIVQALWLKGSPVPGPDRWEKSIDRLADMIPDSIWDTVAMNTIELLDGMSPADHYHSMLAAHDDGELEPQQVVV